MKKYLLALILPFSAMVSQAQNIIAALSIDQQPCSNTATLTASVTSGGVAPYSYTWTGGLTGAVQTLSSGNYSVTITDSSNPPISRVLGASVRSYAIPEIILSAQNITCNNVNVTATVGGVAGSTYIWTDLNQPRSPRQITQAGTYTVSVTSGSDHCTRSVTIQNLRNDITVSETKHICPGQVYTVNGVTYTAGTYTLFSALPSGCIKTTNLTVIQEAPATSSQSVTICQGQSYVFEGVTYTTPGTRPIISATRSVWGCDSTVLLTINVTPYLTRLDRVGKCQGESYSVGTRTYTATGVYRDTLSSGTAGACSTIVTTVLKIYPKYNLTNNVNLCNGDSIIVNGNIYKTTGTYRDAMQGLGGCDSIVTTKLNVYPVTNRAEAVFRCLGESYQVGGVTYTSAAPSVNVYTSHLQSWKGCDSTIVTTLTFADKFKIVKRVRLCTDGSYTVPVPNGPTYTTPGVFDFATPSTTGGCDTLRTTTVEVGTATNVTNTLTICKGQSITVGTNVYTTSGTYTDRFQSFGFLCDSVIVTKLTVSDPQLQSQISYTLCPSGRQLGNVLITANSGIAPYTYAWGNNPSITPYLACLEKGVYSVTVTDAAGCTATKTLTIYDDDYLNCLSLNEGISPDGDVHNETWNIPCIQDVENTVQIFNRWGQLLYSQKNYSGTFNGNVDDKPLPDGTYYYIVDTKERTYRGTLTILRQ